MGESSAVHVVTESGDHYNFLLREDCLSGVAYELKKLMGDEYGWISQAWVTNVDNRPVPVSDLMESVQRFRRKLEDESLPEDEENEEDF